MLETDEKLLSEFRIIIPAMHLSLGVWLTQERCYQK
jgi:hypothetical protein